MELAILYCNKQKEHKSKLKNDSNYAQTYYERKYPLRINEIGSGIELKLSNGSGYPVFATDYDKDGIIDNAYKWVGGGRTGFGKIKYNSNDFEWKELQERYSRVLK